MYRGFAQNKRKEYHMNMLILVVLFVSSWVIFGFNTYNPDYKHYEYAYNTNFKGSTEEIGFKTLCRLFKLMGASYGTFLIVMSFMCLLILVKSINDYTDSPVFVYIAYLFYPFFIDVIQIRMFMSEVVMLYAIRYLMDNSKKNMLIYICLNCLAMTFHSTAITYFVLLIVYIPKVKSVAIVSIAIAGILLFVRFFAFNVLERFISSLTLLGENFTTGSAYMSYTNSYFQLMGRYCLVGGPIIMLSTYRYYKEKSFHTPNAVLIDKQGGVKLAWVSLIFIPLFCYGSSFGRLYRCFLPVLYCILGNGIVMNGKMLKAKNFVCKLYCILVAIVLFYSHIITGELDAYNRIFRTVLDNNVFWH